MAVGHSLEGRARASARQVSLSGEGPEDGVGAGWRCCLTGESEWLVTMRRGRSGLRERFLADRDGS